MKKTPTSLLALMLGFMVLTNAKAQYAKPIPIANGSFESPAVDEGKASGDVPSWGWTGWSGNCLRATVHPGGLGTAEPWQLAPPLGLDEHNFCKLFATADGGTGVLWQDTGI